MLPWQIVYILLLILPCFMHHLLTAFNNQWILFQACWNYVGVYYLYLVGSVPGNTLKMFTADCKSLAAKSAEPRKTTIDLLCLNREAGHAEAGKIIRFDIHSGKSIVVFHCSADFVARLLQSTVHYRALQVACPVTTCNRRWLTQLVVFQFSEQAICN